MPGTHPRNTTRRRLLQRLAALAGGVALPTATRPATDAAAPLCGHALPPDYPAPDAPALIHTWLLGGRQDSAWPDCGGLRARDFELLVQVTASYNASDDLDRQLERLGAMSSLKGASYWSFTDRRRQTLIREAYAVDNPQALRPRADFSSAELRSGAELCFVQSDNRSSALAPYSLQLLQIAPAGFVLRIENLADIRFMGLTLVASHELQWAVSLERLAPALWGYRSLLGLRRLRLGSAEQHRLSNLARSVAMFDLLAGRQTEVEGYR